MTSIAIVVPELLPVPAVQGGAVEHWVDEASARMAGTQWQITVVSRPAGAVGRPGIDYIGIPWTGVERWFQRLKDKVSWRNPLRYVAKIQNVWSYGRRVAAAVLPFDVVIVHNEPNILLFLQRRPGQKLVLHMHNEHLGIRMFRPLYRRALNKVDVVLCVSDYIRREAIRHFPEHAARFQVLFNATDPDKFQPDADARARLDGVVGFDPQLSYLLYVGRLTPIKGVHVLIAAFRQLRAAHPDLRLIITGSSFFGGAAKTDYERELEALAGPVGDAIVFTGYLPHDQLRYLYAAADMVVMPSVWQEPQGLVALEAMASGTFVIGTAVGGIPEVIKHQVNGVLVPPDDIPALAGAIEAALGDPEGRARMLAAARASIVQDYTWQRLVHELNDSLKQLT